MVETWDPDLWPNGISCCLARSLPVQAKQKKPKPNQNISCFRDAGGPQRRETNLW